MEGKETVDKKSRSTAELTPREKSGRRFAGVRNLQWNGAIRSNPGIENIQRKGE